MNGQKVYLRRVDFDDARQLYEWRNETVTRKNSFNTEAISYDNHRAWLSKVIAEQNIYLYILVCGSVSVGQIRVKILDGSGVISYSIDHNYRGLGYGKLILRLLEDKLYADRVACTELIGLVKEDNIPSQKAFVALEYQCKRQKEGYKYKKKL